jgi:hypothetical protein
MTGESRHYAVNCKSFFEWINQIESGETNSNKEWHQVNREARFAERVKAYEKMFYHFLEGLDSPDNLQEMEGCRINHVISHKNVTVTRVKK